MLALLGAPRAAEAQPGGKVYRIGFVVTAPSPEVQHLVKALEEGLRDLGYVEGRNLKLERRFADGRPERQAGLAAELARLNVDVIVTGSNPVIAAVKQATTKIPVVMAASRDPVGAGFVASLARPGGNVTGLTNDPAPEILGKNVEFLKEAVPRISRVGILWNPVPPGAQTYLHAAERAAQRLGVAFQAVEGHGRQDLEGAFAALLRAHAEGLVVLQDPVFFSVRDHIVRRAARHRMPAVYAWREFVEAGGLMSYGVNLGHQFRRAAVYVDKILKGAGPADLPIEQPTKFELF